MNSRREEFLNEIRRRLQKYPPKVRVRKLKKLIESDKFKQAMNLYENVAFMNFVPRPDDPANFDQQHSFCYNRDQVSFLIGGNAAGTTEAAAFKTGLFLLRQQEASRRDLPFWILSNTYDQVCGTCWIEKLLGHGHIPKSEIEWNRISWLDKGRGYPRQVPLKPWVNGNKNHNWVIEFKSYDQGREALQARSIGGFWFSEQFPSDVFLETFRGCRECMFPGGQFCEFTPIDPVLSIWIEEIMQDPPPGWKFYRANTRKNKANLADGWFEQFFGSVSDEMMDVRMTGALATFEGVIYPSFSKEKHVVDKANFPPGCVHFRAIDWGFSEEHPFVCLWGYYEPNGEWTIYDEYWSIDQCVLQEHIARIRERSYEWGYPRGNLSSPYYGCVFGDPARPDNIAAFSEAGFWIQPANNHVYNGIDCVRTLLKVNPQTSRPRIHILSTCKHLIEEMRTYRWLRAKKLSEGGILNPNVAAPKPLKRNDDTVDALRYLVYSHKCQLASATPEYKRDYNRTDWRPAIQWGGAES